MTNEKAMTKQEAIYTLRNECNYWDSPHKIEAYKMAIEALERDIEMMPDSAHHILYCHKCKTQIGIWDKYCKNCGQAIMGREEEDA